MTLELAWGMSYFVELHEPLAQVVYFIAVDWLTVSYLDFETAIGLRFEHARSKEGKHLTVRSLHDVLQHC